MTTTTSLKQMDDAALCRRIDDLGNQVWACRRRGWNRKQQAVQKELQAALAELADRMGE